MNARPAELDEIRRKILPVLLPLGVRQVWLFGSVSRGQSGPDSDVDILVDLKEPDSRPAIGLKWFAAEEELARVLGRSVDLVSTKGLCKHLQGVVDRDKVVLYDESR